MGLWSARGATGAGRDIDLLTFFVVSSPTVQMDSDGATKWSGVLERSSWLLVFVGMLTQVSAEYAFPSYNVVIGFWGAYCAFGRHGRATFALLTFSFFGILLDVAFCSVNNGDSSAFQFALVMLIFCLFIKVYLLFCGAHFFSAIGGAYSVEQSLYDEMPTPGVASYQPPPEDGISSHSVSKG